MSAGFAFGDSEPEDAWHPDDNVRVLLDNLCKRCSVLGEPRRFQGEPNDEELLADLEARAADVERRRDKLDPDDERRLIFVLDDITHIRRRLDG